MGYHSVLFDANPNIRTTARIRDLLSPALGFLMMSALERTSGTSRGVPWKPLKHRGQPFTDRDERRSALTCAAQDERPFETGDDHFSEGPPGGLIGPGE